jgi:hypothetical protein
MKLQLKRSNVLTSGAAKVPTASQLEYGELAINYNDTDPAIFLKDSNNNVIRISGVGNIADDGQVELPASTTPPLNPEAGNLWFNSDEGRLYIYYVDTDTSQWVDASPDSYDPSVVPDMSDPNYQAGTLDDRYNSSQVGTTAPAVTTRQEGALWWNSNNNEGKLYVLYNDPAPDGRKKWVEASPYPDTSGFIRSNDNGTQQNIIGGGGLTIDGNVGIGTLSPAGALHVDAVSGVDGPVFDSGGTANANHALLVRDSANNQLLRVNNNGNVGINTASPAYQLDVQGAGNSRLRVKNTSVTGDAQFHHDGNGDLAIKNSVSGRSINFFNTGSERMRIDSSGNVGIGTSSPYNASGYKSLTLNGSTGSQIRLRTGDSDEGLIYNTANDFNIFTFTDPLRFHTNSTERMRIDSSGNVGINLIPSGGSRLQINGSMRFGGSGSASDSSNPIIYRVSGQDSLAFASGNTERMRIDSSGALKLMAGCPGIDFSGISSSDTYSGTSPTIDSNTLDDYEEGTFVVKLTDSIDRALTIASTNDDMRYIKVGRLVTFTGRFNITGLGTASGPLKMHLPFTTESSFSNSGVNFCALQLQTHGITMAGSSPLGTAFVEVAHSANAGVIYCPNSNSSWEPLQASNLNFSVGVWMYITGSMRVTA